MIYSFKCTVPNDVPRERLYACFCYKKYWREKMNKAKNRFDDYWAFASTVIPFMQSPIHDKMVAALKEVVTFSDVRSAGKSAGACTHIFYSSWNLNDRVSCGFGEGCREGITRILEVRSERRMLAAGTRMTLDVSIGRNADALVPSALFFLSVRSPSRAALFSPLPPLFSRRTLDPITDIAQESENLSGYRREFPIRKPLDKHTKVN